MEQKTFNLGSIKDYDRAEKYKAKLENKGFNVSVLNNGINGVIIRGVLE